MILSSSQVMLSQGRNLQSSGPQFLLVQSRKLGCRLCDVTYSDIVSLGPHWT